MGIGIETEATGIGIPASEAFRYRTEFPYSGTIMKNNKNDAGTSSVPECFGRQNTDAGGFVFDADAQLCSQGSIKITFDLRVI